MKYGYLYGLNSKERFEKLQVSEDIIKETKALLNDTYISNNDKVYEYILSLGFPSPDRNTSYYSLLKRQKVSYEELAKLKHLYDGIYTNR